MIIYFSFKFIFELYWNCLKKHINIISTWNTHTKHLHKAPTQNNINIYIHIHAKKTHTKICTIHQNIYDVHVCHLQLYVFFLTYIQTIIILKIMMCTAQKHLWHTYDVTYNLMYFFQHTSTCIYIYKHIQSHIHTYIYIYT
jgi:hypothetical protein